MEVGSRWLGHCCDSNAAVVQDTPRGWDAETFLALTSAQRRYGWHGTFKAPFELAPDRAEAGLRAGLRDLAANLLSFDLPPLAVQRMHDFLALRPLEHSAELNTVAARCVTDLHAFAAQPDEAAMAARIAADQLDAQQQRLLRRWGYPHVLDRFRFHMTLTGSLEGLTESQVVQIERHARATFSRLVQPLRLDALSLFVEPYPGSQFVRLERNALQ